MALMLRMLGVPARVAAGFTSGEYDKGTGEWVVTDHNAHAWVEVWFPGFGWLPFDPTPGRGQAERGVFLRLAGVPARRRAADSVFSGSSVLDGISPGISCRAALGSSARRG